jgi:hypothetical protein
VPALSALAGVMAVGSALRLRLHNERLRQNEKRDKPIRKMKSSTNLDIGIMGFTPTSSNHSRASVTAPPPSL